MPPPKKSMLQNFLGFMCLYVNLNKTHNFNHNSHVQNLFIRYQRCHIVENYFLLKDDISIELLSK